MIKLFNQIKPVWEIPFPKLYPPYDQHWSEKDRLHFMVLFDISTQRILKSLDSSYDNIFSAEILTNPYLNKKKIEGIINRWGKGLPVDPPLLFWNYQTKTMMIENGIHRLFLAINLNIKKVPILIIRSHFNEFLSLIELKS